LVNEADIYEEDNSKYSNDQVTSIFLFNNNKSFIEFTNFDDYSGYEANNRFYYVEGGKFTDISIKIKPEADYSNFRSYYDSEILFASRDRKYFLEQGTFGQQGGRNKILRNRIFDENVNYISDILEMDNSSILGINLQKNKIRNYFISAHTDSLLKNDKKDWVIIPYEFIPILEIDFYKIYNNKIIESEDLSNLKPDELLLLRNMIFAKYNYKFDSQYYQAYFNIYAFYSEDDKIKNRIKDVTALLTSSDKQNLAIIDKYIVKPDLSSFKPEEILKAKQIVGYIDTLAINIINQDNVNYDISYNNLKEFTDNNKKISKNKELIEQIYLQKGLSIFSSDVSTPYSVIHYQCRNTVNTLSAIYGYEFGNELWMKIYQLFDWYKPTTKTPEFPPAIKNLTDNLSKFENEFK
jgi:hypothetical protein